jgi:hypothetical protein
MMYNELFSSVFPVEFKGLFGDIRKMIWQYVNLIKWILDKVHYQDFVETVMTLWFFIRKFTE